MKKVLGFITILIIAPVTLLAEKSLEEAIRESPKASSMLAEHERLTKKACDEHAKVIVGLNDKLVAALSLAKAEAMRSENLPLALGLDAKIKEINEKSSQLRGSVKSDGKSSAAASVALEAKGAARLITSFISKPSAKLSEVQRAALKDFADGKTALNNPFGNTYFINASGYVCQHRRKGAAKPDDVYRDAIIEDGVLKFGGEHEMVLSEVSGDTIPMRWIRPGSRGGMRYSAKFGPYSDSAEVVETPLRNEQSNTSAAGDSVFGKRQSIK